MKKTTCIICGKEFTPTNPKHTCCGDPKCKNKRKYLALKANRQKYRHHKGANRKNINNQSNKKRDTGRKCRVCGKPIFEFKNEEGIVVFTKYFHCHNAECQRVWNYRSGYYAHGTEPEWIYMPDYEVSDMKYMV